eukprot:TRINITY_DN30289_c0_g1_i1.p2 TRINITY_DN30289_c0_g1~~TRINITY_DN30289_c0_g1_i1.p2  ORF type:complete len:116 (-),score=0.86 TRINITY_DN30289_c0_g1_i1:43-390(-)
MGKKNFCFYFVYILSTCTSASCGFHFHIALFQFKIYFFSFGHYCNSGCRRMYTTLCFCIGYTLNTVNATFKFQRTIYIFTSNFNHYFFITTHCSLAFTYHGCFPAFFGTVTEIHA